MSLLDTITHRPNWAASASDAVGPQGFNDKPLPLHVRLRDAEALLCCMSRKNVNRLVVECREEIARLDKIVTGTKSGRRA